MKVSDFDNLSICQFGSVFGLLMHEDGFLLNSGKINPIKDFQINHFIFNSHAIKTQDVLFECYNGNLKLGMTVVAPLFCISKAYYFQSNYITYLRVSIK